MVLSFVRWIVIAVFVIQVLQSVLSAQPQKIIGNYSIVEAARRRII